MFKIIPKNLYQIFMCMKVKMLFMSVFISINGEILINVIK